MVVYNLFHRGEQVLTYLLVPFGTTLFVILYLIMCGKNSKKKQLEVERGGVDHKAFQPSESDRATAENEVLVEEGIIEVVIQHDTEMEPSLDAISPYGDNGNPLTLDAVNHTIHGRKDDEIPDIPSGDISSHIFNNGPDIGSPPVYVCSENSGNSLYAHVKDLPLQEETAYAIVELQDKDYDFVNGALVRRLPPNVSEGETSDATGHYDKPKPISTVTRKVSYETENSGASGIYESVTDCTRNGDTNRDTETVSNEGFYDSCGPQLEHTAASFPPGYPPLNNIEITNEKSENCKKSDKIDDDGTNIFTKLFNQNSKKHFNKADETQTQNLSSLPATQILTLDIHDDADISPGDGPPPLPSFDKLIHISASRKNQHHNDINPSPDPSCGSSPGESPGSKRKKSSPFTFFEGGEHSRECNTKENSQYSTIEPLRPRRISEGESTDLRTKISHKQYNDIPSEKLEHSASTLCESHVCAEESLISEPDYAEIELNRKSLLPPEIEEDADDVMEGYTRVDYGSRGKHSEPINHSENHKTEQKYAEVPHLEKSPLTNAECENIPTIETIPGVENNSDFECTVNQIEQNTRTEKSCAYAQIDFSKRDEERRIKNLYASIDFNSKSNERQQSLPREEECNDVKDCNDSKEDTPPELSIQTLDKKSDLCPPNIDNSIMPLYEEVTHL